MKSLFEAKYCNSWKFHTSKYSSYTVYYYTTLNMYHYVGFHQYGHIQYSISLTLCYITISASCFILYTSPNRMYCGVSLSNTDILLQLFHILQVTLIYKIIQQEDNIKIFECVQLFYNLHQNGWCLLLVVSTGILQWSVVMCAIWNTSNITYYHYCTPNLSWYDNYHDM